ncbi:MAG: hypothetical protein Q9Q13_04085 [Acidobacteriota bacterium]|nr:hypothetical protein [Acidobacteriota bacterium]
MLLDQVDFDRPLVFVMPIEGMLLQDQGVVAVVPVRNADLALAKLIEGVEGATTQGAITALPVTEEKTVYVQPAKGYLMAAFNRRIAEDARVEDLLDDGLSPPGNISATIQIAPIAPMVQMGLMQVQAMAEEPSRRETQGDDAAGTQATIPSLATYGGLISDALANVATIKLSLELNGDDVLFHHWVVPKTGSSLEAFISAQRATWPKIARFADPSAPVVIVSSVTLTDAARAAFIRWTATQTRGRMRPTQQADGDNPAPSPMALFQSFSRLGTQCSRGDGAASIHLDGSRVPRVAGVQGLLDSEKCRDLPAALARAFGPSAESFTHGHLEAWQNSFPLSLAGPGAPDRQGGTAPSGEVPMAAGLLDDLLLTVLGDDAAQALKALADRIESQKGPGVVPADFAPPSKQGPAPSPGSICGP